MPSPFQESFALLLTTPCERHIHEHGPEFEEPDFQSSLNYTDIKAVNISLTPPYGVGVVSVVGRSLSVSLLLLIRLWCWFVSGLGLHRHGRWPPTMKRNDESAE